MYKVQNQVKVSVNFKDFSNGKLISHKNNKVFELRALSNWIHSFSSRYLNQGSDQRPVLPVPTQLLLRTNFCYWEVAYRIFFSIFAHPWLLTQFLISSSWLLSTKTTSAAMCFSWSFKHCSSLPCLLPHLRIVIQDWGSNETWTAKLHEIY